MKEDINEYFEREVKPHITEAWIDRSKDKVGYEINFSKYFYNYKSLRSLEEIKADIIDIEQQTEGLIKEILQ